MPRLPPKRSLGSSFGARPVPSSSSPIQIYRSYTEKHYHHDFVVYGCGLVQTALYVDFFYYYALR